MRVEFHVVGLALAVGIVHRDGDGLARVAVAEDRGERLVVDDALAVDRDDRQRLAEGRPLVVDRAALLNADDVRADRYVRDGDGGLTVRGLDGRGVLGPGGVADRVEDARRCRSR
ncbi:hypothetical protein BN903_163 [Halorubrum sp. AJ67]|nr:hypothetical protein BN903_163 [Halorubrum sp. AJ67]